MMEIFEVESKKVKAKREMEKTDDVPPVAQGANTLDTDKKQDAWEKWVNKVFEVLVHNAIEEFGPIPRDVYRVIANLSKEKVNRDRAANHRVHVEVLLKHLTQRPRSYGATISTRTCFWR